ncbi:hypothetical protein METBIDRAFT_10130 [Metschnikowia bicuspidata var. bicuspidata NRRL YB-4993]|uniref:Uncharacterized protein n=1 Tax=Metschnikowia bicuspidata var. bicuspidata NRRL YB-4993 TaxID=869754 RepID=A0A1A0HIU6_9ASCO|nr:hypothetical protein METBIDRAFT_10130 [Metschnikowia bicuspidata var. bicuspidata NRRL YB-4993]OBA23926.1 hypothetical protein METBIDRAFT_10130 [Metschnikowia bicuspidata var. bicuspidata NRRL YB-4993]
MHLQVGVRGTTYQYVYSKLARGFGTKPSINSFPAVTGSGPFIELPRIEPFSTHDKGQRLQLPQRSRMNTRLDSMIYLIEDYEGFTRNLKALHGKMWYQEIKLSCSNTLFYSFDLSEASNFALLKVKKGDIWNLKSSYYLAAWTGYDLQIDETKADFNLRGNGFFIARGSGPLYQVELKDGQEILINYSSFVGTSANIVRITSRPLVESRGRSRIWHRIWSMIQVNLFATQKIERISKQTETLGINHAFDWVDKKREKIFLVKDQFCLVKGPGMVVIQNNVS